MKELNLTGSRCKGRRILRTDPALNGMSVPENIILVEGKGHSGSGSYLPFHNIDPAYHLRNRMLHLKPRIHLHKIKIISMEQKFHSANGHITNGLCQALCGLIHFFSDVLCKNRSRTLLNKLLIFSLNRAVPVTKRQNLPVFVGDYLNLHVLHTLKVFFHEDFVIGKRALCFFFYLIEGIFQLSLFSYDSDALASASCSRL